MSDLPVVIRCDGGCGTWIPPDTDPCARTPHPMHGHVELRMCDACRTLLRTPRIETKVVSPGSGDVVEVKPEVRERSSPESMMVSAQQPERRKPGRPARR